jgi:Uma2 family endonuclease
MIFAARLAPMTTGSLERRWDMDAGEHAAHGGPWTLEEWEQLNEIPDGNRFELIDGSLLVSPPPSNYHQYAADELRAILKAAAPEDLRVVSAAGVRLAPSVGLIPDVVVMTADGFHSGSLVGPEHIILVVEVVSPTSTTADRLTKPAKYAAAGIEHYWRVELDRSPDFGADDKPPLVLAHILAGSIYRLAAKLSAGTRGVLPGPFEVEFDAADLLSP